MKPLVLHDDEREHSMEVTRSDPFTVTTERATDMIGPHNVPLEALVCVHFIWVLGREDCSVVSRRLSDELLEAGVDCDARDRVTFHKDVGLEGRRLLPEHTRKKDMKGCEMK